MKIAKNLEVLTNHRIKIFATKSGPSCFACFAQDLKVVNLVQVANDLQVELFQKLCELCFYVFATVSFVQINAQLR